MLLAQQSFGLDEKHVPFLQRPLVQKVLPFAASLGLHVAVLAIGYATYRTAVAIMHVAKPEVVVPEQSFDLTPAVPKYLGNTDDPNHRAEQDIFDEPVTNPGISQMKGASLQNMLSSGSSDATGDSSDIAIGPGTGFNKGKNFGPGQDDGQAGPLAAVGPERGGVPDGTIFTTCPQNVHKIVYLCDASGSMQPVFSTLRSQLKTSSSHLLPGMFFNVIFFSDDNVIPFNNGLVAANPNNQKKLEDFVDDEAPRGGTNPMPAIEQAFANKPDVMYVLTDGFDQINDLESVYTKFATLNSDKKVKVYTILLTDDPDKDKSLVDILRRIAKDNGGQMSIVKKDSLN
jgi:hypothetical protein